MKYNKIENIRAEEFRRLTGVKRITFEKMVEILRDAEIHKKAQGGKPNKLLMEDRLLMTLEYLREYRTYFHMVLSHLLRDRSNWYRFSRKRGLSNADHKPFNAASL